MIAAALLAAPAGASNSVQMQQQQDLQQASANPIRKVVVMLQNMQKKVTEEGAKEQALYDKFMCYCENSDSTLGASISAGENKVSELGSSIKAHVAEKAQLESSLKQAQADRSEAKATMKTATAVRAKENGAYTTESASLKANIGALDGAIAAISKGMGGAFVQTTTAATVRNIAINGPSLSDIDRQDLMAFLSGKQEGGYAPQSGQITGILKTLHDEMSKSLADATSVEGESLESFDGLIAAKTKQVNALTAAVESKSTRVGELGVQIAMEKNDAEDTAAAVAEDTKFLADLAGNCKTKKAEWSSIVTARSNEMVALADTIKILNDDDALEMFKKTLPSSLIQIEASAPIMRAKALALLSKVHSPELNFVALALSGKKVGFGKVIKMIDNMVVQLKVEQTDDDQKKEYCNLQFDTAEDKKKGLEQKVSDLETSIDDAKEGISTTKAELEALADGIKALDKSVAEATEQRKAEHSDHTELMANDSAARRFWSLRRTG